MLLTNNLINQISIYQQFQKMNQLIILLQEKYKINFNFILTINDKKFLLKILNKQNCIFIKKKLINKNKIKFFF